MIRRGGARGTECAAVGLVEHLRPEERAPVRRAIAAFAVGQGEHDRLVLHLLQPDGGESVLVPVVVRFEDEPGQSAELPRPVADGDVRREPRRPAPPAEVARGLLAGVTQDLLRAVVQRPCLPVQRIHVRHFVLPQVVSHGEGARGMVLVHDGGGAAVREAVEELLAVAVLA